ncbi:MAG: SRPBCC domain-containing protein [Acidimicrobiales bacterium]
MKGSTNSVVVPLPPADTYALVSDPSTYPSWLVGAKEIRHVDRRWPEVGTTFKHRIGLGPLRVPGTTTVRVAEPPSRLVLGAGMGPMGEARVEFVLREADGGTEVTVHELPRRGLVRLGWLAGRHLVTALLWGRNEISLHDLAQLAAGRRTRRSTD